jgi:ATP-dependent HslUV protease ATP-binding subunit HslU
MVRDLVELAVDMVRAEKGEEVKDKARAAAEERMLDLLLPPSRPPMPGEDPSGRDQTSSGTRERMREQLRDGRLDERVVELDVQTPAMPSFEIIAGSSVEEIGVNLKDMVGNMFGGRSKTRRLKVPQALEQLTAEEQSKLLDMESVSRTAVQRVEQAGIIFVDEIDKIASRDGAGGGHGPDVSREGVQRDILPIVEGTTVNTKHGMVKTDHILFIAAGAFHVAKPSDLIPELQGRFPIRVELEPLTRADFVRILTEPRNALVKQYIALLGTEELDVTFTQGAVERIADFAARVNDTTENIGARRLHTVMERLLDELSFDAPDRADKSVTIDEAYVERMLADIVRNEDLSRYIL